MKLLLDTHILIWVSSDSRRLSAECLGLITDLENELYFSAASLWEIAIKTVQGRRDFDVDVGVLREGLLERGYGELSVLGTHSCRLSDLPLLHKDPFDRMLVAQAMVEGMVLVTVDAQLGRYAAPVRMV